MVRNDAPYDWMPRNRKAHDTSEPRHNKKYPTRLVTKPPNQAPARQPAMAPRADANPVYAFALEFAAPAILSAHNGSHWTEPHVPIRAIEESMIAINVYLSSGGLRTSVNGRTFVVLALT